MDAGLAALVGAAIGTVGTSGTAFVSGWWARKQALLQSQTQLEQASLQIRSEHLRDRRAPRGEAYSNLIVRFQEISRTAMEQWHAALADEDEAARIAGEKLKELIDSLDGYTARVAVEGPSVAGRTAATVAKQAREVYFRLAIPGFFVDRPASQEEATKAAVDAAQVQQTAIESLDEGIDAFIETARECLEADGIQ